MPKNKTLDQIIKDLEKTVADIERIKVNADNYIKNPIKKASKLKHYHNFWDTPQFEGNIERAREIASIHNARELEKAQNNLRYNPQLRSYEDFL